MEEGPEPQEFLERAEENKHAAGHGEHGEHGEGNKGFVTRSAICASILAVMAAIGSLLSGHAANEAILLQSKATDQWAYFQAKSTKSHIASSNAELIKAVANLEGKPEEQISSILKSSQAKIKKYDEEKDEIQHKADELEKESEKELASHQKYSLGVACFQVGIVLASMSILVKSKFLYFSSLAAGVVGIALAVLGFLS